MGRSKSGWVGGGGEGERQRESERERDRILCFAVDVLVLNGDALGGGGLVVVAGQRVGRSEERERAGGGLWLQC